MREPLQELFDRLPAEFDRERVIKAAEAVVASAGNADPRPWLQPLADFVAAIAATPHGELWSALDYNALPLLPVAGSDAAIWRNLLQAAAAMLSVREDGRLQQNAVRFTAEALPSLPASVLAVFAGARELLQHGYDAGWFVQLVVPPAAATATTVPFVERWQSLVGFAFAVNRAGVHVGYPLATGLAALLARPDVDPLPEWLAVLTPLAITAAGNAYGLFEYALPPLFSSALDKNDLLASLRLALTMLDHGIAPGPTLAHLYDAQSLAIATRLAHAGVDPVAVVTNGAPAFAQLGWLDDGGDRLVKLASELHRRGLRQLLFEDGMPTLVAFEEKGLAGTALALIEAMVAHDLEPGPMFRWTLPRTFPYLPAWAHAPVLAFARQLVDIGASPDPAMTWAVRPIAELAADGEEFARLASPLVPLVRDLGTAGVDADEKVFTGVSQLAAAAQGAPVFAELLASFATLLRTWTRERLDVAPLLGTALPAAAREAQGRPWMLSTALAAADRLAKQHRGQEALVLLESGVGTAAAAAGSAPEFAQALEVVEARYAALPPTIAAPASAAAATVAGADLQKLGRALELLAALAARHGDALTTIADALPELARMAAAVDELPPLVDAMVGLGATLPANAPWSTLARVATAASSSAAEGIIGMRSLAAALAEAPKREALLYPFASLARHLPPKALGAQLAAVDKALAPVTERTLAWDLLQQARDLPSLQRMLEVLPPVLVNPNWQLQNGLMRAKELLQRDDRSWPFLVLPTLQTAGAHSGSLLAILREIPAHHLANDDDLAAIQRLVTQSGVKAIDQLANLVVPALKAGVIPSLAAHEPLLARYRREIGFADVEVYAQFVAIVEDPIPDGDRLQELRDQVVTLTAAVRAGEVARELRQQPLFGVALQHVFPPAVGVTRQHYLRLVETMADRQADVSACFPGAAAATIEVMVGGYRLRPDAKGLEVFAWCRDVLPAADTSTLEPAELGWQLLTAWAEDRLARPLVKRELTQLLLRLVPAEALPAADHEAPAQLLAIRQLAGDRLMALVEQVILAARAADLGRVERLVRAKLDPPQTIGPGLQKAVKATLAAATAGKVTAEVAAERLRSQLQAFELPDDPLQALRNDPSLLGRLPPKAQPIDPGKEIRRVHADLVGQELAAMNAAIARVLEYVPASEPLRLSAELTKRSVHAPIGYTTGVCTTPDEELWRQPTFLHLALFRGDVCVGGVHLLLLTEGEQRFVALPGINPSSALLEQVDAEQLVRALLNHIKALAQQAGCAGVWIPVHPGIHSNRHVVGEVLLAMQLPMRSTQGHAFSYSPYAYRIDDVFEWR
jgi:hypothetical protein